MKIIVTSHGDLCEGILDSYEMLAGKNENIIAIPLRENDTGEFENKITELVKSIDDDILVLCDIYGGTPYNVSYYLYLEQSNRLRVVSGLNLPMLLETGLSLNN
ncbi:PTS mannose/fructose/sorbose family IIA subunit [Carnobacteriaceae bacterium 52-44]